MFDQKRRRVTPSISGSVASNDSDNNLDYDGEDGTRETASSSADGKLPHSLVEKKRRDKMSLLVTKLSDMIPMCGAMNRKLDKITVLRMCVQHLKSIRGNHFVSETSALQPGVLLGTHILKIAKKSIKGLVFVVACDRGKLLFVSVSVKDVLNCGHNDIFGQSLFDLLHQKDIMNVKDQLLSSGTRKVFIDARTLEPVNPDVVLPREPLPMVSSGSSRFFFCRMKNGSGQHLDSSADDCAESSSAAAAAGSKRRRQARTFTTLACSGYLKFWTSPKLPAAAQVPPEVPVGSSSTSSSSFAAASAGAAGGVGSAPPPANPTVVASEENSNLSCLVAVAHVPQVFGANDQASWQGIASGQGVTSIQQLCFSTRLSDDGRCLFVDTCVFTVTGHLPHNIVGTGFTDYVHDEDVSAVSSLLSEAIHAKGKITSSPFRFKRSDGTYTVVRCTAWCFVNPWTRDVEFITCTVSLVEDGTPIDDGSCGESRRRGPYTSESWLQEQQQQVTQIKYETPRSVDSSNTDQSYEEASPTVRATSEGSAVTPEDNDNDNQEMSIIMNILEADGGLGGRVDFTDLPWPL